MRTLRFKQDTVTELEQKLWKVDREEEGGPLWLGNKRYIFRWTNVSSDADGCSALSNDFVERASKVINVLIAKARQRNFLRNWHKGRGRIGELERQYIEGNDLMNTDAISREKGGFDLVTEKIINWIYAICRRVSFNAPRPDMGHVPSTSPLSNI